MHMIFEVGSLDDFFSLRLCASAVNSFSWKG